MPPGVRNRPSYVMSFDFILCSNQPNGDFGRPAACHMSAKGHSRPARAGTKPGHVRYAPIAIKFRSEAKCRDGPDCDIAVLFCRHQPGSTAG
jgi:hypothetical protein